MAFETHTRIDGEGYRIDVAMRITADPGHESYALARAGRLRRELEGST